ncbi:MAG: putative ABC transporter ATP-binding protein YadG [Hyphomicrobiaceae bacterium hypho_1]
MPDMISITNLSKTYSSGFQALSSVNLDIRRGEVFALLGPNGAGKSTLINIICGLVDSSSGSVMVDGQDVIRKYRYTRSIIGLVPQELNTDTFETVKNTVCFSRGLFGKPSNYEYIEKILRDLSLWDKRDCLITSLSGGMKRRLLIAKALSHEPAVLFLDEPTAGVDVKLRHDMWRMVRNLRESGVTIVLTTHYIKEVEEMADRVGVINDGKLLIVEQTQVLIRKLGKKKLIFQLHYPTINIPEILSPFELCISESGMELTYSYNTPKECADIRKLLNALNDVGLTFSNLYTEQSSLEDIFLELIENGKA